MTIPRLHEQPIAIIGMASLFPKAQNLSEYWSNIVQEIDCLTEVPPSRWKWQDYYDPDPTVADKTYCKRGGFIPDIDFNPLEFGLRPNILELTDASQLLSLIVTREALKDAGYTDMSEQIRRNTGVVLGVGGGQKLMIPLIARLQYPIWEQVLRSSGIPEPDIKIITEKIKKAYIPWEENSFPGLLGNVIAGRITNRFDLGGINCVVDAACAASLAATRMAIGELVEHRADMMITGGVDTDNSIFMYMSFSKTPAFSKRQKSQPFDAEADGMIIGEGLGMLILKRLADAERDGDRIYAVIKGFGSSSDGRFKSIYAPRSDGQALALERAYQDAGFAPETVGLIEAHGTGTATGDPEEFNSLKKIFGQQNESGPHIALGSVKSQIGHTKAAAGAASLIKATLALHHKILPPTINVTKPNPKYGIEDSPFYINANTRPWLRRDKDTPRRAGVSSFGFGGTNYHIILEEYQAEHAQAYRLHNVPHGILIASPTPVALLAKCEQLLVQLQGEYPENCFSNLVNESHSLIPQRNYARVGFVVQSVSEAIELLQIAIEQLKNNPSKNEWSHPKGICYRQTGMETKGRVVALFSGQGSQYLNMANSLAINFPQVRQTLQAYNAIESEGNNLSSIIYPPPAFDEQTKIAQEKNLQNTEHAQPAIGIISSSMYKIFTQAGFQADFTAGHSFGELTALWATGVLTDQNYLRLIKARGEAMSHRNAPPNSDSGSMLAVTASVQKLKPLLTSFSKISMANLNSHEQVVLAGPKVEVEKVQQSFQQNGLKTVLLPVSAAFHTTLVAHSQKPFSEAIRAIEFNSPQLPVYSNSTGQPYPTDPKAIKQILADHILKPVLFKDEIENIYAAGGTIFVEFGPKNVLTSLVKSILGNKPHVAIALNTKKGSDQLREFLYSNVQLQVLGLQMTGIDNYQIMPEVVSVTTQKPAINVKINGGANYVSEATRSQFQEALNSGHNLKIDEMAMANEPKADTDSQTHKFANQTQNLSQFYVHQATTAQAHQQYLQQQARFATTFMELSQNFATVTNKDTKTEIEMILKHQAETAQTHQQYLQQQATVFMELSQNFVRSADNNTDIEYLQFNSFLNLVNNHSEQIADLGHHGKNGDTNGKNGFHKDKILSYELPQNADKVVNLQASPTQNVSKVMLEVVSEKTGYPIEMLSLDMDMESDLGIDSINRVEILAGVQERYPNLPKVNPEDLAEFRTLREIVDHISVNVTQKQELPSHNIKRLSVCLEQLLEPDFSEFKLPEGQICLLTDDGTNTTVELARSLQSRGLQVIVMSFPGYIVPSQNWPDNGIKRIMLNDLSETHLQEQLAIGQIAAFIHLSPCRQIPTNSSVQDILNVEADKALLKYVFLLAKHLKKSHLRTFMTIARLDGMLGLNNSEAPLIQGGLFGLTKTLGQEWPSVFCRAVDLAPSLQPQKTVKYILAEFHDFNNRLITEVGYTQTNTRVTLVAN